MKKNNNTVSVPHDLLQRLNEFSAGGFLLFSFDGDGDPSLHCSFDNTLNFFALHKHAENWVNASNMLAASSCAESIVDSEGPPPKRRRKKGWE